MAKLESDAHFRLREGNILFYPWQGKMIVRTVSGFTSESLKTDTKYELSRKNASEFGRVSAECKKIRVALSEILPHENNLAVVRAFTKKMREVLNCDTTNARGSRTLTEALGTEAGRELLIGYEFNPDTKITAKATGNNIVFRLHRLVFDFATGSGELASTDWLFEKPDMITESDRQFANVSGILFTIIETSRYTYQNELAVPIAEGKSIRVLECGLCL